MNVQAGDLAFIVAGRKPNIGRLVYVARFFGDIDYSKDGYGVLPCWTVESLGSPLDARRGAVQRGHIPDMALRKQDSGITAAVLRRSKAEQDAASALTELSAIFELTRSCERP